MARKKWITLVICIISAMSIHAQNSPLIGTWEGTLTMEIPDTEGMKDYQYKTIIRIKQYDDEFIVRMKHVPTEEPSKVRYFDNSTVISSSSKSISWNCGSSRSYDCGYVVNGQTVYCADFSYNCSVQFDKGRLLFQYYMHTIYNNKSGKVIGTHDTPILGKTYLYKQEEDW